ncbi:putative monooxygenase [Moniliophthora roreri]|nr:putative monooxygenase [Moniliophthora roreri]
MRQTCETFFRVVEHTHFFINSFENMDITDDESLMITRFSKIPCFDEIRSIVEGDLLEWAHLVQDIWKHAEESIQFQCPRLEPGFQW